MSDLKDDTFIAVKEAVTELDWPIAIYSIEQLALAVSTHPILSHKPYSASEYEAWVKTVGYTKED